MTYQLIGQRGRGGKGSGFRQGSNIFQQAFDLLADDVRARQALKDIELNFANSVELYEALAGLQPFGECHQQVGYPRRGREHHQANAGVGEHHVGAAVHGIEIGDAGPAKFSNNRLSNTKRGKCVDHNNLVSGANSQPWNKERAKNGVGAEQ